MNTFFEKLSSLQKSLLVQGVRTRPDLIKQLDELYVIHYQSDIINVLKNHHTHIFLLGNLNNQLYQIQLVVEHSSTQQNDIDIVGFYIHDVVKEKERQSYQSYEPFLNFTKIVNMNMKLDEKLPTKMKQRKNKI